MEKRKKKSTGVKMRASLQIAMRETLLSLRAGLLKNVPAGPSTCWLRSQIKLPQSCCSASAGWCVRIQSAIRTQPEWKSTVSNSVLFIYSSGCSRSAGGSKDKLITPKPTLSHFHTNKPPSHNTLFYVRTKLSKAERNARAGNNLKENKFASFD